MTPRFHNRPLVRQVDEKRWQLEEPLGYDSAILNRTIIVPAGFVTDWASVPRLPLVYLAAGNTAHRPALVHDLLYQTGAVPRSTADAVFYEAMAVDDVALWRRSVMWGAVRLFGWGAYGGSRLGDINPDFATSEQDWWNQSP